MWLLFALALWIPSPSLAIGCYECNSSNNFTCTEFWDTTLASVIEPHLSIDCSHVFEVRIQSHFHQSCKILSS